MGRTADLAGNRRPDDWLRPGVETRGVDPSGRYAADFVPRGCGPPAYAENRGAFLSLGADLPRWARTALFTVGTSLVLVACAVSLFTQSWPPLAVLGICLYLAGGASNLADRVADGHVIDFLNIGLGPLRTGIFNIADMAVMAGVTLFLFAHFRPGGRADSAHPTLTTKP